jgi:hypothetical protein
MCYLRDLASLGLAMILAACATDPTYLEMKSKIPTLDPAQGRVFVYRDSTFGAAIQPQVMINGKVVGVSRGNGIFYTDLPAGDYRLSSQTEVERSLRSVSREEKSSS